MEALNWISLLVMAAVIVVGVVKKINIGFIAIGVAYILGKIGGLADGEIIGGFGTSLFLMLLGVMFLFGISQVNGTLELLSKKILAVTGKSAKLIPFILYLVAIFIAAIGPGTVPTLTIMAVFSVALAKEMKASPILLASLTTLGATVGGLSSIASTGIIGIKLAEDIGVTNAFPGFWISTLIAATAVSIAIYVLYKGYKAETALPYTSKDLPAFDKKQWITLVGMLAMIVLVLVFKFNVGMISFMIGIILLLLGAAEMNKVLPTIAWGTLILVSGFSVLMAVVSKLGGIDLLSTMLASIMNKTIAPMIMSISGGILSFFSSVSGVVMPTLIPTIPKIVETVPGTNPAELISAIVAGAHATGISPITGGALILSACASVGQATPEENNKYYLELWKLAFIGLVIGAVIALTGVYRLFV